MTKIVNKVYNSYNKVSYLQRNKKCYSLETIFQKKVNFSKQVRFIRSYYLTTFQIPVAATLSSLVMLLEKKTFEQKPTEK